MSGSNYYKDQDELAAACGMSRSNLRHFTSLPGFPAKTKSGYPKRCVEFVREAQAEKLKGDGSLKDEKLKREIERLDIRIGQDRGELVNRKEEEAGYRAKLMSYRSVIESWRQHNVAKFPEQADIVDGLADELINQMKGD